MLALKIQASSNQSSNISLTTWRPTTHGTYSIRLVGQWVLLNILADVSSLQDLVLFLLLAQLDAGLGSASSQVLENQKVKVMRESETPKPSCQKAKAKAKALTSKSLPLFLKLLSLLPCSSILSVLSGFVVDIEVFSFDLLVGLRSKWQCKKSERADWGLETTGLSSMS